MATFRSQSGFSPLSPCPSLGNFVERIQDAGRFLVSAVLGTLLSAILTFFFALVGTLLGALTGALIGQETESGFIRGAAVGAISGAVFSTWLWHQKENWFRHHSLTKNHCIQRQNTSCLLVTCRGQSLPRH